MEISAPEEWYALLDVLKEEKGIVIILGATDTGKSSLAKFLIFNLCKRGLKVALVDADIGQSFLGPPATIGLSVFKSDPDWQLVLSPPEIFFVGSTTPEGCFPLYLKGTKKMVYKASLERVAQRLSRSFNTTGSKSALDRWKYRLASEHDFLEILRKPEFSGTLSINEYMPQRGARYEQIAGEMPSKSEFPKSNPFLGSMAKA